MLHGNAERACLAACPKLARQYRVVRPTCAFPAGADAARLSVDARPAREDFRWLTTPASTVSPVGAKIGGTVARACRSAPSGSRR
jgi:hypothetical protein